MRAIGVSRAMLGRFEAWVLESDRLRAVILPELGGRVWELTDLARKRQWIWNRGAEKLHACAVGTNYDDNWAGGWEELFPNDAAGQFEGRALPDHGEWWASSWRVAVQNKNANCDLYLESRLSIINVVCSKEFLLSEDGATLIVRYRIRSEEREPFHFLFKQHLPLALTTHCELQLPGGTMRAVDPRFGSFVTDDFEHQWPIARHEGKAIDLRVVPPESSCRREFLYVRDLPEGWCGVDDRSYGASIRMHYDSKRLPFVWLFLTFGGWRECYTAVLEPCTNMPKDLAEAVSLGQSARLAPDKEFLTEVSVTVSDLLPGEDVAAHNRQRRSLIAGDLR